MSIVERSLQRVKSKEPRAEAAYKEAADPSAAVLLSRSVREPQKRRWPVAGQDLPSLAYARDVAEKQGFLAPKEEQAGLSGQMRVLRRGVLDAVASRRAAGEAPVIVVTSPLPGDGKSFVALNLASAFANDPDVVVTLVDADITRQQVSRLFTGSPRSTLSRSITDRSSVADAVHRTDLNGLQLVPAGEFSHQLPDRMASSSWDSVVAEMRTAGPSNLFFVDTPPVLATSESQYLARCADLVLVVVRAEVTPRSAVEETVARLEDTRAAALVFNGFAAPGPAGYHNYASYYEPRD